MTSLEDRLAAGHPANLGLTCGCPAAPDDGLDFAGSWALLRDHPALMWVPPLWRHDPDGPVYRAIERNLLVEVVDDATGTSLVRLATGPLRRGARHRHQSTRPAPTRVRALPLPLSRQSHLALSSPAVDGRHVGRRDRPSRGARNPCPNTPTAGPRPLFAGRGGVVRQPGVRLRRLRPSGQARCDGCVGECRGRGSGRRFLAVACGVPAFDDLGGDEDEDVGVVVAVAPVEFVPGLEV